MSRFTDQLAVQIIPTPGHAPDVYLWGKVDFPNHPNIEVCVRPLRGQPVLDPAMLAAAERRCESIVANVDRILRDGRGVIHKLFLEYWPDRRDVAPDELLEGLKPDHVMIDFGNGDVLSLRENRHYPAFDLFVRLGPEGSVQEAWFDG